MVRAEKIKIKSGATVDELREVAGESVFLEIIRRWPPRPVIVLCGPGNNGADGFVVARLLKKAGWPVRVATISGGKGDICPLTPECLNIGDLVVDALFGAGLKRPIKGAIKETIDLINEYRFDCVSVDLPSGVEGNTGKVLGVAPKCIVTVTFFRRKVGHLLLPGRDLAGDVVVADIGISESILKEIKPKFFSNAPDFWMNEYPSLKAKYNKYSRGHAIVASGAEMTGAARLASTGARRIGAGVATIVATGSSINLHRADDPGNIVIRIDDKEAFQKFIDDSKKKAILVGPGCGINKRTRDLTLATLLSGVPTVLDADALSVFSEDPVNLFDSIKNGGPTVLTPHEGEYQRIFNFSGSKIRRSIQASKISGAVVLLKGSDTVISSPSGFVCINECAPPTLATAGSGDVLSGFIVGLLAQGMSSFEATCAACWLHSQAALKFGPALIAEDIAECLSDVLQDLQKAGTNKT